MSAIEVFQSAPPCGERRDGRVQATIDHSFNPRPPAESDLRKDHSPPAGRRFNPRPPCGERRIRSHPRRPCPCFNPRPPAESDKQRHSHDGAHAVSIRAPLRRATPAGQAGRAAEHVSIRAPLRRATAASIAFERAMMFQSAPPCGERHKGCRQEGACKGRFNPRPPAESDRYQSLSRPSTNGFNPRPPAESDHRFRNLGIVRLVSIRAPLRRATRDTLQELYTVLFQSAPPAESDHGIQRDRHDHVVSIRAPLRRATSSRLEAYSISGVSIRAPLRRATSRISQRSASRSFNPRPPAESDIRARPCRCPSRGFNPRPLRRATRVRRSPASGIEFQSAPPCGERRDIREGGCG